MILHKIYPSWQPLLCDSMAAASPFFPPDTWWVSLCRQLQLLSGHRKQGPFLLTSEFLSVIQSNPWSIGLLKWDHLSPVHD